MHEEQIALSVLAEGGRRRFVAIKLHGADDIPTIRLDDATDVDKLIERLLMARTLAFGLPLVAMPSTGFPRGTT
jgi:hypothetical protein